jgi:hypothetical protein
MPEARNQAFRSASLPRGHAMNTSEQINELATALSKAQGEMGGAVKDAANPFFKSKYADLASVRDATREPFAKHGLSVAQFPKTEFLGEAQPYEWTAKSGETRYGVRVVCVVSVVTRLMHASGQFLEDAVSTMLSTGDPQAVGSAVSYLRRYAWQCVAGVAPEDDDAEAATGQGTTTAATPRAASGPMPTCQKCKSAAKVIVSKFGPGHYCLSCKANVQSAPADLFSRAPSALSPDELAAAGVE